jgi:DNA-binding CsgD family transcriptional regulator
MLSAMGLRGSDVTAVVDVLDELDSTTSDEAGFLRAVAAGVERLIPADTVWWASCDYGRRRNAMASSDDRLGPAYETKQARWWELYDQHPLLEHRDRTGEERAYTLSDFASRQALRGLEIYDEFFRPYGIEYSLSVRICVSPGRALDIGATRATRDFSGRDRAVLDLIRPAIRAALRLREAASGAYRAAGLTERETEVVLLAASGLSNAQIGAELFIAPGTVKKHLDRIYEKLGVGNRTQAAAWARPLLAEPGTAAPS